MKTIYKYRIDAVSQTVRLPIESQILSVGVQYDSDSGTEHLYLWALVTPKKPLIDRNIIAVGTGWDTEVDDCVFLGTVHAEAGFVWHVFEKIKDIS